MDAITWSLDDLTKVLEYNNCDTIMPILNGKYSDNEKINKIFIYFFIAK